VAPTLEIETNADLDADVDEQDGMELPLPDANGAERADLSWCSRARDDEDRGAAAFSKIQPRTDGPYLLRVPPGTVEIRAEAPAHASAAQFVVVTPGAHASATLKLKTGGELVVTLESGGKPFAEREAWVSIDPVDEIEPAQTDSDVIVFKGTMTSPWGRAEFKNVEIGTYRVVADAAGWTSTTERVEVKPGATRKVVLKLERKR
jgi:hypothetical protein